MTESEKPTKNMTLRLDEGLAARVEALAEIESLSVTQVIREALTLHIERRKGDPDFRSKLQVRLSRQMEIEQMFALDPDSESTPD